MGRHRTVPRRQLWCNSDQLVAVETIGTVQCKHQVDASKIISENLYVRDESSFVQDESIRSQSLVYVHPMNLSPAMKDNQSNNPPPPFLQSPQEHTEFVVLDNDHRARPPKEELSFFLTGRSQPQQKKAKQSKTRRPLPRVGRQPFCTD